MLRKIGDRPSVASKLIAFLREFFRKHFDRIWKERYAFRVHLDLKEPFSSTEILWNNFHFPANCLMMMNWSLTVHSFNARFWWNHFSTSKSLIKSTETKTSMLQFAGKIARTRRVLVRKFSHNFLFWFFDFPETFSNALKLKKWSIFVQESSLFCQKKEQVYFHFRSIPKSFSKSIDSKWNKFCNIFWKLKNSQKKQFKIFISFYKSNIDSWVHEWAAKFSGKLSKISATVSEMERTNLGLVELAGGLGNGPSLVHLSESSAYSPQK